MDKLQDFRNHIDQIDDKIINLLAERFRIVKNIGKYKRETGISPLDRQRWKQLLSSRLATAKSLGLPGEMVAKIYNTIHEFALELEDGIRQAR